jgi:hypothetical protein
MGPRGGAAAAVLLAVTVVLLLYGTLAVPLACTRGHFCGGGAPLPQPCPMGTYSNATNLVSVDACSPCLPGMYCFTSGLIGTRKRACGCMQLSHWLRAVRMCVASLVGCACTRAFCAGWCVCLCVCVLVCVRLFACACLCVCVCVCVCMCMCLSLCMCLCLCVPLFVSLSVPVSLSAVVVVVCRGVCICVRLFVFFVLTYFCV